jgi:hypothetical protein
MVMDQTNFTERTRSQEPGCSSREQHQFLETDDKFPGTAKLTKYLGTQIANKRLPYAALGDRP